MLWLKTAASRRTPAHPRPGLRHGARPNRRSRPTHHRWHRLLLLRQRLPRRVRTQPPGRAEPRGAGRRIGGHKQMRSGACVLPTDPSRPHNGAIPCALPPRSGRQAGERDRRRPARGADRLGHESHLVSSSGIYPALIARHPAPDAVSRNSFFAAWGHVGERREGPKSPRVPNGVPSRTLRSSEGSRPHLPPVLASVRRAKHVTGADSRGGKSRTFALATTWRSCGNRESGACGDADTLAIADGAVAHGPRPGCQQEPKSAPGLGSENCITAPATAHLPMWRLYPAPAPAARRSPDPSEFRRIADDLLAELERGHIQSNA